MREKETAAWFSPEPLLYLMLIAVNAAKKNYALLD
jgi:hypothetical protein